MSLQASIARYAIRKQPELWLALMADPDAGPALVRMLESHPDARAKLVSDLLSTNTGFAAFVQEALRDSERLFLAVQKPLVDSLHEATFRDKLQIDGVVAQWVQDDEYLKTLDLDVLLNELSVRIRNGRLAASRVVDAVGQDAVADVLPRKLLSAKLPPDDPNLRESLLNEPAALRRIVADKRALHAIAEDPAFLRKMSEDIEFMTAVGNDPTVLRRLLKKSRILSTELAHAELREELGLNEASRKWYSIPKLLSQASPKELLDELRSRVRDGGVRMRDIVTHLGEPEVAQAISVKTFLDRIDPADAQLREMVLRDPVATRKILEDERSATVAVQDLDVRSQFQAIYARERAAKLSYLLPALVVSFPRSGSNYLQSVLQGSSGLWCQSIYSELTEWPETVLTLKSHSPTPEYLHDEWLRTFPQWSFPRKIIMLQRDPRDLMISFLEYTAARREQPIAPEEFLHDVDYFYASTIDRGFRRRLYKKGLTVAEAFKISIRSWILEPPGDQDLLRVKYEDLVLDPKKTFQAVFDYLELDCALAEKYLTIKVSQYSGDDRPRGAPYSWRNLKERYGVLLDDVTQTFSGEIKALGYPLE